MGALDFAYCIRIHKDPLDNKQRMFIQSLLCQGGLAETQR